MSVTREELERFHHFAADKLRNDGADLSIEELLRAWRTAEERASVNEAIRDGLADVQAGNYRPMEVFMDDFRKANNIPESR
jgi:hypothetical protein